MELGISSFVSNASIHRVITGWGKFLIIVASLFLASLLAIGAIYFYKKFKNKSNKQTETEERVSLTSDFKEKWPSQGIIM